MRQRSGAGRRCLEGKQRPGRNNEPLSCTSSELPFDLPHGQAIDDSYLLDRGHDFADLYTEVVGAALD